MGNTGAHIEIANWDEYQHYKHRNPPWIKLHAQMLDSCDLMELDPQDRWLAVGLMLLASRTGNRIPAKYGFLTNRLWMDDLSGVERLRQVGFLTCSQDASAMLAKCSGHCTLSRVEAETETDSVATQPADAGGKNVENPQAGTGPDPWADPRQAGESPRLVAARFLPIVRAVKLHNPDRPPKHRDGRDWTEGSEVRLICQMLLKGYDPDDIEFAIRGLAWARDTGRLEDVAAAKGESLTLRLVYDPTGKRARGTDSMWTQAVQAGRKFAARVAA